MNLAAKIEKVAADRMSYRGGRQQVESEYSRSRSFDRLLGIYERAILARQRELTAE